MRLKVTEHQILELRGSRAAIEGAWYLLSGDTPQGEEVICLLTECVVRALPVLGNFLDQAKLAEDAEFTESQRNMLQWATRQVEEDNIEQGIDLTSDLQGDPMI